MTDLSRIHVSRPARPQPINRQFTDPQPIDPHGTDPHGTAAFATLARRALHEGGYSMRAAARAINYDPAYLSRVLNGKQPPSPKLAASLDRLLDTGGVLGEALRRGRPEEAPVVAEDIRGRLVRICLRLMHDPRTPAGLAELAHQTARTVCREFRPDAQADGQATEPVAEPRRLGEGGWSAG
ncbi:helix-turn-helix transcriptional regulator [Streptomyces sp. B6B3]|uniref:helix-turn-helix domain-containing protein n=1 Tax=Streptomyces sp. B6B3 TaxID=3153570 RepID=UPI00325D46F4